METQNHHLLSCGSSVENTQTVSTIDSGNINIVPTIRPKNKMTIISPFLLFHSNSLEFEITEDKCLEDLDFNSIRDNSIDRKVDWNLSFDTNTCSTTISTSCSPVSSPTSSQLKKGTILERLERRKQITRF